MKDATFSTALLLAALAPACLAVAQAKPSAAIPATVPTQSVSDLPSAQPTAASPASGRTRVTWNGAQLTIEANGEPMPDVLSRVARQTGMKISGGVPDERLFGKYGPGLVQVVMGQLFEGLGVNMMLVNDSPTRPKELILTARTGGPTSAPAATTRQVAETAPQQDGVDEPVVLSSPPQILGGRPAAANQGAPSGNGTGAGAPAFPQLPPPPAENNSFTNTGNPDTTQPAENSTQDGSADQPESPNGVKTPEQIFEELRRRAEANQNQ